MVHIDQTTRRYIQQDSALHSHRRPYLKFHISYSYRLLVRQTHPDMNEHTASSLVHVQRDIYYPMSPIVARPLFGIAQPVQWLGYELDEWIRGSSSRRVTRLFFTPKCPGRISGPPSPYSMATETSSRAMECQRCDPHHSSPTCGEVKINSSYTSHCTWFQGTRRNCFTSSKLLNITNMTLHGDKLYRENRFSHFNKQFL